MKEKIIKSALKLFANKGYHATNVQEIANLAGIARGTLYANFSSKQNILIAIYEHYLDSLYESLKKSTPRHYDTLKDRLSYLQEVIHCYISVAFQHEDFLIMQLKEQSINEPHVIEFVQEKRTKIYLEFQKLMRYVAGDELHYCVIDAAVILNSLIEEYSTVVILDGVKLPVEQLADFITQTIGCIFIGFQHHKITPILSNNYQKNKEIWDHQSFMNEISSKLQDMNHILNNLVLESDLQEEISLSVHLINTEIKKDDFNPVIIKGMLRNIGQVKELSFIINDLLDILNRHSLLPAETIT